MASLRILAPFSKTLIIVPHNVPSELNFRIAFYFDPFALPLILQICNVVKLFKLCLLPLFLSMQIVDRPTQGHIFLSREYVQPQWVYDCVNARIILPTVAYLVGRYIFIGTNYSSALVCLYAIFCLSNLIAIIYVIGEVNRCSTIRFVVISNTTRPQKLKAIRVWTYNVY